MKKYIEVSMRPYPFLLLVTSDKATYTKLYKTHFGEERKIEEAEHGLCSRGNSVDGIRMAVVYAANTQALVHELVHVVTYVFGGMGVPINDDNTETFAYLIEQLFSDALRIFDKKRK
jgi:hypothetical protein